MSSILSITAPQFTAEDERIEWNSYTDVEKQEIQQDLYGWRRWRRPRSVDRRTCQQQPQNDDARQEATQTGRDPADEVVATTENGGAPRSEFRQQLQQQLKPLPSPPPSPDGPHKQKQEQQVHPDHVGRQEEIGVLLQDFQEALNSLEMEEREAYVQGMNLTSPWPALQDYLWQVEAPPLGFLRWNQNRHYSANDDDESYGIVNHYGNNQDEGIWAAVERFNNYYGLRAWLFGNDTVSNSSDGAGSQRENNSDSTGTYDWDATFTSTEHSSDSVQHPPSSHRRSQTSLTDHIHFNGNNGRGNRAWLPMTSTGNGCLDERDCVLLETGFCSLLDEDTDASGRGVLCFHVLPPPRPRRRSSVPSSDSEVSSTSRSFMTDEKERKTKKEAPNTPSLPSSNVSTLDYDRMSMMRVIFYMLTVAYERDSVQRNGLVVVAGVKNYSTRHFDRKFLKCLSYLCTGHYHPIQMKGFHMCASPGHKSCFLMVLPFIKYFMTRKIRQRFLVHRGTEREVATDLEGYGIKKENLPISLGGKRTKRDFYAWLQDRRIEEAKRESFIFGTAN